MPSAWVVRLGGTGRNAAYGAAQSMRALQGIPTQSYSPCKTIGHPPKPWGRSIAGRNERDSFRFSCCRGESDCKDVNTGVLLSQVPSARPRLCRGRTPVRTS